MYSLILTCALLALLLALWTALSKIMEAFVCFMPWFPKEDFGVLVDFDSINHNRNTIILKTFNVKTTIEAPARTVWGLLTNADEYGGWNSTVDKIEGEISLGKRLKVFAKIQPDRVFPVRVVEFDAPRRMVWKGGLPLGLFKGERVFELRSLESGVVFTMEEKFTGFLSSLICKSIPDLQPSFDEFAACLKSRAEDLSAC